VDDEIERTFEALLAVFEHAGYRKTMGMHIRRGEGDEAVIECLVAPQFANTQGVAHGGLLSGLIDTAAGIASKLAARDAKLRVATVSLTVNYHRPGRVGQTLRAVGRHVSGRSTPCCSVEVRDPGGNLVASGVATLRVASRGRS